MRDFADQFAFMQNPSITAAFLAEGPGGFIESFVASRSEAQYTTPEENDVLEHQSKTPDENINVCSAHASALQDTIYGITLLSPNKNVPNWKLSNEFIKSNNIKLLRGQDLTGSLYGKENFENFVKNIGRNSCEYVTADGGFDFSDDYNNQEQISMQLILAEVYMCMHIQKIGGTFVLKIYDISLNSTKMLLSILNDSYESMTFCKPLTSRTANSEKYVILNKFKGCDHMEILEYCFKYGANKLENYNFKNVDLYDQIAFYNIVFMTHQILSINNTLLNCSCETNNLMLQLEHAIKWCHKYGVQINKKSILYYKYLIKYNNNEPQRL
jgi:hypothetical protein